MFFADQDQLTSSPELLDKLFATSPTQETSNMWLTFHLKTRFEQMALVFVTGCLKHKRTCYWAAIGFHRLGSRPVILRTQPFKNTLHVREPFQYCEDQIQSFDNGADAANKGGNEA